MKILIPLFLTSILLFSCKTSGVNSAYAPKKSSKMGTPGFEKPRLSKGSKGRSSVFAQKQPKVKIKSQMKARAGLFR
jgi:hypothetical protein